MKNSFTIFGLILAIIGLLFAFPESLNSILNNKLYTLAAILTLFLIGFAIFIKIRER